jgi:hypothetical protein
MSEDTISPGSPWYESNVFWGPLSLAFGVILTVTAAVKHDLRWLLLFAWPCFGIAIWWLARRTREVLLISVLGTVLAGAGLLWLSGWLRPQQSATAVLAPSSPTQPPHQQASPTSEPIPAQIPQPVPKTTIPRSQRTSPAPTHPVVTPSPSAALPPIGNNHQGGNGDCQANALGGNATVENSCNGRVPPPPRIIPSEHYKALRDYLAATPSKVIVSVSGGKESYDFAHALYNLLKDAGWTMEDGDVRATMPIGPPWEGTTVKFQGTPIPAGQRELITGNKPEDHLGQVLGVLTANPNADRSDTYPEGLIEIRIGDQPM